MASTLGSGLEVSGGVCVTGGGICVSGGVSELVSELVWIGIDLRG